MRAGTHKSRLAQPKKKRSRCAAFICSRAAVTGVRGVRGAVARLVGNEEGVVSGVINLESSGVKRRTVDHAMTSVTTKPDSWQLGAETAPHLFDDWFDPIESEVRARAREFSEALLPHKAFSCYVAPNLAGNLGEYEAAGGSWHLRGLRHLAACAIARRACQRSSQFDLSRGRMLTWA